MRLNHAKVTDADPGADLSAPHLDDSAWLAIDVPGDLHTALLRAGRIPDPNHGDDATECAWVEEREWWWRIPFSANPAADGERIELTAHGLDTFATVYLNGVALGRHRNMFRPVSFDITDAIQADNVLAICFHRPLAEVDTGDGATARFVVARMRKAQLSYGWDFAPRRPAVGPWLPIELIRRTAPKIESLNVRTTALSADRTTAEIEVDLEIDNPATVSVAVSITDPDGAQVVTTTTQVAGTGSVNVTLEEPAVWWPHDLGRPDLHTVTAAVVVEDRVVDSRSIRFGVRTIELDREPDSYGRAFTFVINGEPMSARGANWVPADLALAEPDPERYRSLITATRDGNMNMLRIWGGGIYEHDVFYDLCDELGVLVWQDFMFACLPYSDDQDADWQSEIEAEAVHQVRRLRSHPSLALWCGNNEVAMIAELVIGHGVRPGNQIFTELLPAVVAREDGARSYVDTTPLVGPINEVDRHCWKVWHGIDETNPESYVGAAAMDNDGTPVAFGSPEAIEFVQQAGPHGYLTDQSRFTSEYGLASASELETVQRWTDPEHQVLGDPQVESRLSPATRGPANKFDLLYTAIAGEPSDLLEYCQLSQLAQAEGLKVGMEHYRRGWPRCGGSLVWMLNDCWPATSWSLIDFDGRKKAAYYYAKRAFAPALASFAPIDDALQLWLTNNSRALIEDELVVRRLAFDGTVHWETKVAVDAERATSASVLTLPAEALAEPTTSYLEVRSAGGWVAPNRHFGVPVRDLQREIVAPEFDWRTNGREISVTVKAETLSLVTHLAVPGAPVEWSDDYFDLAAGESRTVTTTEAFATESLSIRSR
jgi:beta-mannosidase